ncbi:membrane protein [Legionella antarctica]|uniref:Membrane protein n=1 Tax=Legionella antarctica TaxID=2708020 RepID=A0A6F8T3Q1_9GAMM|nr:outer membrane beta-barrel protein [Legionella antarctica]BCA94833.1 membrane protein [Legionella antarctica]
MNKTWTYLSLTLVLYGTHTFGAIYRSWTGFYIGANAGYLWSSNNTIKNEGVAGFANSLFLPDSQAISSSLGLLGTKNLFNSSKGFIGGGQVGYNSQFSNNLVIGIDTDLDAIDQSSGITTSTNFVSTPQLGIQTANIENTKKLNYLGLLKGRLGVLISPSFLIYGAGGLAYGEGSLKTSYSVTSTNPVFLPFHEEIDYSKILAGWAAGGGAEWLFSPCWSMKVEYIYYRLGPLHTLLNLTQNINTIPPTPFATASVESEARFSENTIRIGINYFFS